MMFSDTIAHVTVAIRGSPVNQTEYESENEVVLITNPAANRGQAAKVGREVLAILEARGVKVRHEIPASPAGTRLAAEQVANSGGRLIACGGDGLIHLVAQEIAGSAATLGVIPAGSGNDFASALGLSSDLNRALQAALSPAGQVDVLQLESESGRRAIGVTIATAGFSAKVNVRADNMRWPKGSSRYTIATLRELLNLERYELELRVDGTEIGGVCLMVAIANTHSFGGGMKIAPAADSTDGVAEIVIVRDTRALTLLRMLPKTFNGSHVDHPAIELFRGSDIELGLRPLNSEMACQLRSDGEDVGSLPQTVTVTSAGLHVAGCL